MIIAKILIGISIIMLILGCSNVQSQPIIINVYLNVSTGSNTEIDPYIQELIEFQKIAKRFSSQHNYSEDYNCVNYTKDLKMIGDMLGYKTYRASAYAHDNLSDHAFLKVYLDIEPQSGEYIDYSKYYVKQSITSSYYNIDLPK